VHTMASLLDDPHLNDVDFFQFEDHPSEGTLRAMRLPMHFSGSPVMNRRPTPHVGEHTVELLREAGLSTAEIDKLFADGVVHAGAPGQATTSS
jgi:crotonobetainyl-CoA:carnitine CoA-transferase CaiB-like acyl-CoA transferase